MIMAEKENNRIIIILKEYGWEELGVMPVEEGKGKAIPVTGREGP
jgi:hypothetical protein